MYELFSDRLVASLAGPNLHFIPVVNPLALELDIYSLAHHLCKM